MKPRREVFGVERGIRGVHAPLDVKGIAVMPAGAIAASRSCRYLRVIVPLLLYPALIAAFLRIASQLENSGPLTEADTLVGLALQEQRNQLPILRVVLIAFTLLAAFETMVVLVPLIAIFLWRRGRTLALFFLFMGIGAGTFNTAMKRHFDRTRPPWKDARVYENNESFPSGHSFSSASVFGLLTYILARFQSRRRIALIVGGVSVILIVGYSRVFLGAHYLSDVLGGFCCGTAWLLLWIFAIEALDLIPRAGISAPG